MLPPSARRSLVVHPTPIYLVVTFFLALFALGVAPSFVPLVLLLATLRLFITVVITRKNSGIKLALITICLAAATTLANIGSSLNAIPEIYTATAIFALFLLSYLTSILIVAAIMLDMSLRLKDYRKWAQHILFPTVWSTVLLIASATSPLGYLATWNPVVGIGAYSWMRPILGPTGIDWVVGAWAVVVSELIGSWIMGPSDPTDSYQEQTLISTSSEDTVDEPEHKRRTPWLLCTTILLCLGTLPSYFQETLPMPVNSLFTTPLPVACALPYVGNKTRQPVFDEYLQEATILASLAKVVLWPEGAVQFDTEEAKQKAIEKVAQVAAGSVIGVSFEEHMSDTKDTDKIRNGFMLIDKDGLVLEYFKRHLVPFVETNAMVAYSSPPEVFDYQLVTKRNSRNKPKEFLSVPITVSICMDFAHPMPFNKLARRPSLILGPAHTWHSSIGYAMWEQAKARAEEVGSAVLWCDGGGEGISGVGGRGLEGGEVVQVGPGSWVRTIGLETTANDKRTFYTFVGPWLSIILIWFVFGTEKVIEMALRRFGVGGSAILKGKGVQKKVLESYRAWKRGRQADAAVDEHTHLI